MFDIFGGIVIYAWLNEQLRTEFEVVRLLKESPRGSVELIRHRESGRQFILRRFTGNGEVYRKLLDCSCRYLPVIYEMAEQDGEILGFATLDGDYFDHLFVRWDRQGQGIAKALAQVLEDRVWAKGCEQIRVHASITARPFFEKRGYRLVKEQQVERNGQKLTNFVMVLQA